MIVTCRKRHEYSCSRSGDLNDGKFSFSTLEMIPLTARFFLTWLVFI